MQKRNSVEIAIHGSDSPCVAIAALCIPPQVLHPVVFENLLILLTHTQVWDDNGLADLGQRTCILLQDRRCTCTHKELLFRESPEINCIWTPFNAAIPTQMSSTHFGPNWSKDGDERLTAVMTHQGNCCLTLGN